MAILVSSGQLTITDQNDVPVGSLSNDTFSVPSKSDGSDPNFTGCTTTLSIYVGAVNDSANWTYTVSLDNVTATSSDNNRTQTVTGMTSGVDTATITFTAKKAGYSDIVKVFSVTKAKQGLLGPGVTLTTSRTPEFSFTDNVLNTTGNGDITFTANTVNMTGQTYVWKKDNTIVSGQTGSTFTVTSTDFGTAATSMKITCEVTFSSQVYKAESTISRLNKSTAAANANNTSVDVSGNIQGVSSGAGTQVSNQKLKDQFTGKNILSGITATGSVTITNVAYLIDSIKNISNTSYAEFSSGAQWIQFDLSSEKYIDSIYTYWYNYDDRQYNYAIAISSDGTTWKWLEGTGSAAGAVSTYTTSRALVNKYGKTTVNVIPCPTITSVKDFARYIKIFANGNTVNTGNHLYEVEVYSGGAPGDTYLDSLNSVKIAASGTAAPSTPKEGDLWFDETNLVYKVYINGAWEEKTISASMITAGTISADRIAANSINASKILLGSPNMLYDIDSFEQYAGKTPPGSAGTSTNIVTNEIRVPHGKYALKHVSTAANSYKYLNPDANNANAWCRLEAGKQYILSAYVYTTSTTPTSVELSAIPAEYGTSTAAGTQVTTTLTISKSSGWARISVKLTDVTGTDPALRFYIRNISTGITSYWDCFMLEEVATTITTPSPFVAGGTTRIDPQSIVTGTITSGTSITIGTPTTAAGGIVIDSGSVAGQDTITVKVSNTERVRIGYLGTVGAVDTYGLRISDGVSTLFDSRNSIGILGSTTTNNYNLGTFNTNPSWNTSTYGVHNLALGNAALNFVQSDKVRSFNVAIGTGASTFLSHGESNVSIGYNAMSGGSDVSPITANNSVSIGTAAAANVSLMENAIAIGPSALGADLISGFTVTNAIAIGYQAAMMLPDAYGLANADDAIVMGSYAAQLAYNINNSIILGVGAGLYGAASAVAIGPYALGSTQTPGDSALALPGGSYSVAIGLYAGTNVTLGQSNVFIGNACAGDFLQTATLAGSYNVGIGDSALRMLGGSSTGNIGIGASSGQSLTEATYNILIGDSSAYALTTGSNNILIGQYVAETLTTGGGNVVIGNYANTPAANTNNNTIIASGKGTVLHHDGSHWKTNNNHIASGTASHSGAQFAANGTGTGTTQYGFLVNTTTVEASNAFYGFYATGAPNTEPDALVAAYRSDYVARSGDLVPVILSHKTSGMLYYIVDSWPTKTTNGLLPGLLATVAGTNVGNGNFTIYSLATNVNTTISTTISCSTANKTITFGAAVSLAKGARIYSSSGVLLGTLANTISSSTTGTFVANATQTLTNHSGSKFTYCAVAVYSPGPDIPLATDVGTIKAYSNTLNFYNSSTGTAPNFFDSTVAINADLNVTGSFRVGGNLYTTGSIFSVDGGAIFVAPGSADGSDTEYAAIAGGSSVSTSRGGFVIAYGNEHVSTPGRVRIIAGSTAPTGAQIVLENSVRIVGTVFTKQSLPIAKTASASLTVTEILSDIITISSTAAPTLTLPTGASLDDTLAAGLPNDCAFEWSIININTGACMLVGSSGHTYVGNTNIGANTSARFKTRKVGTDTYVTYRIS